MLRYKCMGKKFYCLNKGEYLWVKPYGLFILVLLEQRRK